MTSILLASSLKINIFSKSSLEYVLLCYNISKVSKSSNYTAYPTKTVFQTTLESSYGNF